MKRNPAEQMRNRTFILTAPYAKGDFHAPIICISDLQVSELRGRSNGALCRLRLHLISSKDGLFISPDKKTSR